MEILVKLKTDRPYLTAEDVKEDLLLCEEEIGWNYDYKVISVEVGNETQLEKKLRDKSPEEQYDLLYWLMHVFGRGYASSDQARIDWIRGDIKEKPDGRV